MFEGVGVGIGEGYFFPDFFVYFYFGVFAPIFQEFVVGLLFALCDDALFFGLSGCFVKGGVHAGYIVGGFAFDDFRGYLAVGQGFNGFFEFVIQGGVVASEGFGGCAQVLVYFFCKSIHVG